jgi:hypothetical protein
MQTLHVSRDFEADAATIFEVIADHAGYADLPGVRAAWLRTPGETERGGVGAERVIQLPLMRFVERITDYKPGELLGYKIIESPLPIEHVGARIMLQPLGSDAIRTRVHWTSRLRGKTPLGAELTAFALTQKMRLAYRGVLEVWARRLSA